MRGRLPAVGRDGGVEAQGVPGSIAVDGPRRCCGDGSVAAVDGGRSATGVVRLRSEALWHGHAAADPPGLPPERPFLAPPPPLPKHDLHGSDLGHPSQDQLGCPGLLTYGIKHFHLQENARFHPLETSGLEPAWGV